MDFYVNSQLALSSIKETYKYLQTLSPHQRSGEKGSKDT